MRVTRRRIARALCRLPEHRWPGEAPRPARRWLAPGLTCAAIVAVLIFLAPPPRSRAMAALASAAERYSPTYERTVCLLDGQHYWSQEVWRDGERSKFQAVDGPAWPGDRHQSITWRTFPHIWFNGRPDGSTFMLQWFPDSWDQGMPPRELMPPEIAWDNPEVQRRIGGFDRFLRAPSFRTERCVFEGQPAYRLSVDGADYGPDRTFIVTEDGERILDWSTIRHDSEEREWDISTEAVSYDPLPPGTLDLPRAADDVWHFWCHGITRDEPLHRIQPTWLDLTDAQREAARSAIDAFAARLLAGGPERWAGLLDPNLLPAMCADGAVGPMNVAADLERWAERHHGRIDNLRLRLDFILSCDEPVQVLVDYYGLADLVPERSECLLALTWAEAGVPGAAKPLAGQSILILSPDGDGYRVAGWSPPFELGRQETR